MRLLNLEDAVYGPGSVAGNVHWEWNDGDISFWNYKNLQQTECVFEGTVILSKEGLYTPQQVWTELSLLLLDRDVMCVSAHVVDAALPLPDILNPSLS